MNTPTGINILTGMKGTHLYTLTSMNTLIGMNTHLYTLTCMNTLTGMNIHLYTLNSRLERWGRQNH